MEGAYYYDTFMGDGDFLPTVQKHQDVRVLSITDTLETLTRLQERMKQPNTSHRMKKRVKGLQDLSLTLAMDDAASVPPEQVVALCQAVTKCFPKLQSLEICSEIDERAHITNSNNNKLMEDESSGRFHLYELTSPQVFRFPIQALTVLLHPNKGLKKLRELTLDGLCLDADDDRMRLLVKAIEKHASLEQCYLYDTSMTTLVKTGRSGMEKLVGAVAKRCHKLVIVGCKLAPPSSSSASTTRGKGCVWAGSCLVKLCRSTTLREVKLHNLPDLREEHIVLMSQALGTNTFLRKLSILKLQELPRLPEEGDLPKKKKKSLKRDGSEEELSSDAGTLALANMLRVNSTLEELCLSAVDFTDYSAMFLGNALEQDNCTLTDLWLMIPAHNGGTSSFPVDDKRIDYYLRLNRAGRKNFIKQPKCQLEQSQAKNTQDDRPEDSSSTTVNTDVAGVCGEGGKKVEQRLEQIESLVHSKRDIDCSFYKLRNRPSLCEFLFGPDFNDS